MKKILCILLCALMLFSITSCYAVQVPRSGVWYCDDLQILISFEKRMSYAIRNEEYIMCDCWNDKGCAYFSVVSQEMENTEYPLGMVLFQGEIVEVDDTQFIVREELSNTMYVFRSIDLGTGNLLSSPSV